MSMVIPHPIHVDVPDAPNGTRVDTYLNDALLFSTDLSDVDPTARGLTIRHIRDAFVAPGYHVIVR